jgi:hypothetical protein
MFAVVRNANTSSREETCEPTFRSPPPTDPLPFRVSQRRFSGDGRMFGDVILRGLPAFAAGNTRTISAG